MVTSKPRPKLDERTRFIIREFYLAIGTEQAAELIALLDAEDYLGIARAKIDPSRYTSTEQFALDYAAISFAKKLDGFPTGVDRTDAALRVFKDAETMCESTNVRFMNARPFSNGIEPLLSRAREIIANIIGHKPDYDRIYSLMKWGPGATATIKGENVRPESKLLEPKLSVSPKAYRLAARVVGNDVHWTKSRVEKIPKTEVLGPCTLLGREFSICNYMRVVAVKKTSMIDRIIGAVPTMDGFCQQGVGKSFRQDLLKSGVNLNDQTWNQKLARVAGQFGLCTIDLSSASDTVSYWLVEDLLPPAWFQLCDALRCTKALLPSGKLVTLEKFASMGNAFIFELESLIFYALCHAVCDEMGIPVEYLSVYGDDIIVDRRAYARIQELFRVCGFVINTDKSYASGRFFESCGVQAFNGVDCTPLYQKEMLHGLPELVRLHNRILRWCDRTLISAHRFRRVLRCLREEATSEASRMKVAVPRVPHGTEGDLGLWTDNLKVHWCNGLILVYVLEAVPNSVETTSFEALLAVALKRSHRFDPSQSLRCHDEHTAFEGKVSLRGDPEYRVRRRWIEAPKTCVSQEGWLDWFTKSKPTITGPYLIPQFRSHVTLR